MDKTEALKDIKRLAADAQPAKALERLLALTEQLPGYEALHSHALQVQSQYKKAERDAVMGIIDDNQSKLNYNRTIHQILALVQDLEAGRRQPKTESAPLAQDKPGTTILKWGSLLLIVLLLAFGWWWWGQSQEGTSQTEDQVSQTDAPADSPCPAFPAEEGFRILLLPFQELNQKGNRPHLAIGSRLGQLKERYGIACGIRYYDLDPNDLNAYPATTADATQIGSNCQAQLIIWGSTEQAQDRAIVQTQYRFLEAGTLPLHRLNMLGSTEVDTLTSLSSIATEGLLTSNIENSIRLLFGLIAHGAGNGPVAIELLESTELQDASAERSRHLVLADNYLMQDQKDRAVEHYDSVLDDSPEDALALNNRSLIYYQKGQFAEAAKGISELIGQAPDRLMPELLEIRASAFLKSDQLPRAQQDLEQLKSLKTGASGIEQKLREVQNLLNSAKQAQQSAERQLRADPNDLQALQRKAEASQKLGDYAESIRASEAILSRDPNNMAAYTQLIKVYQVQDEEEKTTQTLKRAERAGLQSDQVLRQVPTSQLRVRPEIRTIRRQ